MFYYIEMGINKLLVLFKLGVQKCEEVVNWYKCTQKGKKIDLEE